MSKTYKGTNGNLTLESDCVIISRGFKGFISSGGKIKGDKKIPYENIVATEFKKAGLVSGFIQFSIKSGNEAKRGIFQATRDENTITFSRNNKQWLSVKDEIESKMGSANKTTSNLDELEKLASLKEKGIITEKEFKKKKKELLA